MTTNLMQLSRNEKLTYLQLLEERRQRARERPLDYCKRHPKQIDAHEAMQAVRALFWGNRVGKTEWGGEEVSEYATLHHKHRELKPPFTIWAACPSFDVQKKTTQLKLMRYLPRHEIKSISWIRKGIMKEIELHNGVSIEFKSYEQGAEKFQGAGVRLIWFDEEPPHDIWEESFVRVEAGQQLDVILTMTAVKGMTWVYDDIYLDTGNPDLFISEAGWDDNPWLTDQQKAQMSRGLSPAAIQVRKHGKFVKRVGLVCTWWDRSKHLRHYDYLDPSWTWYEVFDGGWSDPAAWLLVGVDHDNNIHVVDGFRRKEMRKEEIAAQRNAKRGRLMITQGWTDDNDPRLVRELADEYKIYLTPVKKEPNESESWDETLAEVLARYGKVQAGTGQPRLFVSDQLVQTSAHTGKEENWLVQEIENLLWLQQVDKQGQQTKPKWDGHRRFGHHFDGIRSLAYLLVSYEQPADDDDEVVATSNNISDYFNN